jgi:hypothetical protein
VRAAVPQRTPTTILTGRRGLGYELAVWLLVDELRFRGTQPHKAGDGIAGDLTSTA